jgi:hypothetical protein
MTKYDSTQQIEKDLKLAIACYVDAYEATVPEAVEAIQRMIARQAEELMAEDWKVAQDLGLSEVEYAAESVILYGWERAKRLHAGASDEFFVKVQACLARKEQE